jgi:hypothetical protein
MFVKALNSKFMAPPKSGMIVREVILLQPAHYYYRFAHSMVRGSQQTRDQIIGGAWWMEADVFNTIKQRALRSGSHVTAAARRDLAIAKRWEGKLDIIVRALIVGPIAGYKGTGTIQSFESMTDNDQSVWIPYGGASQIYVPGLREKHPTSGARIYTLAFAHAEQNRVGWDPTR